MTSPHAHSHDGAHSHGSAHAHSHDFDASDERTRRALVGALVLTTIILLAEAIGGWITGSLALLSDAAHMFTDAGAFALALVAFRLRSRPPTLARTYGYRRAELLAALVNGATLVAATGWIIVEAIRRLLDPQPVQGGATAFIATIGLIANLVAIWLLARADRGNINIRGAFLHAIGDAASSVVVLGAGLAIALTGIDRIDPVASLLVSLLVLFAGLRLLRESVDALMDAVPPHIKLSNLVADMLEHPDVREVHDLHVWRMGANDVALSAHVGIRLEADSPAVLADLRKMFEDHQIHHSTIQLGTARSTDGLDLERLRPVADAQDWAIQHIGIVRSDLPLDIVSTAVGQAAAAVPNPESVSPVGLSLRALAIIGESEESSAATD